MQVMEKSKTLKNTIGVAVLLIASAIVAALLWITNYEISGSYVWGHLFKAKYLYNSIKSGNLFPVYFRDWYNGSEPYRHFAPLSYYVFASQLFVAGGNIQHAYSLFIGVLYFIGGLPWVIWGNIEKLRARGTFIGLCWLLLPGMLKILMAEGDIPQAMAGVITPYIILFIWLYVRKEKKWSALGIALSTMCLVLTNLLIAAIVFVCFIIYTIIDGCAQKSWYRGLMSILYMFYGFLLSGIWLVPAGFNGMMRNGTQAGDGSGYSLPVVSSLNPFERIFVDHNMFYFGVLIVVVCICGILFSRDRKIAGFIFPLVMLFISSPLILKTLSALSFVNNMWVSRVAPSMYAVFFASFMEWRTLKKKYSIEVALLIIADIIPTFLLGMYFQPTDAMAISDAELLKTITEHRGSMLDLGVYESYPAYGICVDGNTDYTYGWDYSGASISSNIMMLNTALERGNFLYLFDRSIELGDDSILILKSQIRSGDYDVNDLISSANASGYQLVRETEIAYVFKKELPEEFGVITTYYGIAIGKFANEMTLIYPAFVEGESRYIDDYEFEELRNYSTIYLSGFMYHDRGAAEELIDALGESGVRIVIDSTHMPSDPINKNEEFMGVLNQTVVFENLFPTLRLYNQYYVLGRFSEEDTKFSTGYISFIDNVLGDYSLNGKTFAFCGVQDDHPNVYFVALNLLYYANSTGDETVTEILDVVLNSSQSVLPLRRIVPLEVEITDKRIVVTSEYDNVNTTLAYQGIFDSDSAISSENNLLVVNSGTTVIDLEYPKLVPATIVSFSGLVVLLFTLLIEDTVKRRINTKDIA